MTKETHNNSYERKPTIQELLDDKSGKYTNLQIILNRKDNRSLGLGQEYLAVNNIGFGVYQLNDIDYSDGIILLTLTNISNGNRVEITMDINDEHPQYFLICWEDIKQMVDALT